MDSHAVNQRFRVAALCERNLNERQKRVLDLIVEGRTNREIGAALGMTLDGAKWNVSEILTKLGLSSREEAAAYWHWRKRRRLPAMPGTASFRALLGLPALKWVAGGAGAVGLVAALGILAGYLLQEDNEPTPFYLAAEIRVYDEDEAARLASEGVAVDSWTAERSLEWWYRDQSHAHWTVTRTTPLLQADRLIRRTYDGEKARTYELGGSLTGTLFTDPLNTPASDDSADRGPVSDTVGPQGADSVAELVSYLATLGIATEVEADVELGGAGPVTRLRYSSAREVMVSPQAGLLVTEGTIWVDPVTMVALRHEGSGPAGRFEAVVTAFDWDAAHDDQQFVFAYPSAEWEEAARRADAAIAAEEDGTPGDGAD